MAVHNRLSIIGNKYGLLYVLDEAGSALHPGESSHSLWLCKCDCGSDVTVYGASLTSGNTTSCGCAARKKLSERMTGHGMSGTRTYRIWQAMLNRCRNSSVSNYMRYGGRGIKVCDRWLSFEAFYADMGEAPTGHSIDRRDNDGDYCPSNCRWADRIAQSRNTSANRIISLNGVTKCLSAWAEDIGIDQASLRERLEKWPIERALTEKKRSY